MHPMCKQHFTFKTSCYHSYMIIRITTLITSTITTCLLTKRILKNQNHLLDNHKGEFKAPQHH
jgi:hypothetical protein